MTQMTRIDLSFKFWIIVVVRIDRSRKRVPYLRFEGKRNC